MSISRPTRTVEDETMIANVQSRIRDRLRGLPRVDAQGREVTGPDPTVLSVVGAAVVTGQPTTMVAALESVAASLGVNLSALVDSQQFITSVGSVDPADTQTLTALVSEALVANPTLALARPGMQPNRAQGSSAGGAVPVQPLTAKERIASQLAKLPTVDGQGHVIGLSN